MGTYNITTSSSSPWGGGVQLINNLVSAKTAYTDTRPYTWLPGKNIASSWLTYANTGNTSSLTPVITSPTTASAKVGTTFAYQISATNSPTTYNASSLPSGLSVNTSSGAITGTPKTSGVTTITVSASNTLGSGSAQVPLTVSTGTVNTVSFSQWETNNGIAGASPTATPFHDGVTYFLKYFSDINPTIPMTTAMRAYLPSVGLSSNGQYITLTYRQSSTATGVTPTVQTCTDLASWIAVVNPPYYQQTTDPATSDLITTVGVAIPSTGFQFLRLNLQ